MIRRHLGAALVLLLAACADPSVVPECPRVGTPGLSPAKDLTAFALFKADNNLPVDAVAKISGTAVQLFLPPGTDLSALKSTFVASAKAAVTVGGAVQASGATANDFSGPVPYRVTAEDGTCQVYPVQVVTDIAAFDDAVTAFMSKYGFPGASIAVTKDERLIYLKSYGYADVAAGQQTTTQSLFRLASVSKPITSITIMKLIDQGLLRMDDTIFGEGGLLGTTYGTLPYGPGITEITLSQLLHHTSGGWPNDAADPMFLHPGLDKAALISRTLDSQPLSYAPGTRFAYSNFGYFLLGRVIERVTGQAYQDAVRSLVLAPLGISDMAIGGSWLVDRLPNEVRYYGQSRENPYVFNIPRLDAAGGWVATAKDLATILVHVDGFPAKTDLLSAASITTMTTTTPVSEGYACGWGVQGGNWNHTGGIPGTATVIYRTAQGWTWVLLLNSASTTPSSWSEIHDVLWNALGNLFAYPEYDLF
jgi:CubicO group peptidase (beta-lactamase class C family)